MSTNGKAFLLDTNVIIGLFAADSDILEPLKQAAEIYTCSVVVGELYYGAYRSHHVQKNLERIQTFARNIPILICDEGTAEHYGRIKQALHSKGRPIPENDIWIAAIAQQHTLIVATRDSHFQEVDDIDITMW